ncbi:MAG: 1-acyl-sn-glycerol-3-phosphate acyltransferase [Acholeplasmatales bacterium]|nr:1-acyl-sn-glycerol-3-phosphate acyltransferase [Acholeplasmatales bacterium]
MKNIIPIFFACDNNFFKFTLVTLKSIMDNANPIYFYKIYVLNTDITPLNMDIARDFVNDNFSIEFPNVNEYLDSISDKLPIRDYYSKTTYFRFFISEMYKEYDKAIYIDSDTVVLGDISELYNINLGDNLVGACNEQAMLQNDIYGKYVENNLGLDRTTYFNAGLLLINCQKFREECVLDQFINLLSVYNCKVTQDEDYLNIICYNKTKLIDNRWNTEIYGDIKYTDSEIKMIHYIMWCKPWHFLGVRLEKYFWKYAIKTPFYNEIKNILDNYTDEERNRDLESSKRLERLAMDEIQREDTFINVKDKIGVKSVDRLKISKKIMEYEEMGKFDQDVEQDPPTKELLPDQVDYLKKKVTSKAKTSLAYFIARLYMNRLIKKENMIIKEIKGVENLASLECGAIMTCNHFNALDSFAIQVAYESSITTRKERRKRRFYRVIREGNYTSFNGFYGFLMRNCYTLPLSSNSKTMHKFLKSVSRILQEGHLVLVYPEQSMWWNYRKPKPLKKGAFQFAVKNNVPVVPCFITMEDSDKIGPDGFNIQEYTIHISKPIYPDENKSYVENVEYLMNENYNEWVRIYESVYHEKLTYTTREASL